MPIAHFPPAPNASSKSNNTALAPCLKAQFMQLLDPKPVRLTANQLTIHHFVSPKFHASDENDRPVMYRKKKNGPSL